MTREKAAVNEDLSKQKTKTSKESRGSFLDLIILLPVLAFIFFSITHPVWYTVHIAEPLFGPLLKSLGTWLKA